MTPTLTELINQDSITAAWFWVTSLDAGPYAENEQFDAVFVRETNYVVGGGYRERRTLYVRGITTTQTDSRRENGGRAIRPDLAHSLASVIADAHEAAQYTSFRAWALDVRDTSAGYRAAIDDYDDWEIHRARHREIARWLDGEGSDTYDAYVQAAAEYAAEH